MFKKLALIIIILVILGFGFVFYRAFTSFQPEAVVEQENVEQLNLVEVENSALLRRGSFNEIDLIHKGGGQASVYQTGSGSILKLEDNFQVTNGPDLFVYLSDQANIGPDKKDIGRFISLGRLQKPAGEQNYILPDNWSDYQSVVIWCRAFGVLFSAADLR
ncbi:MAG TPA: DM13 domain-containing protein [Patescibacteria group bacterium]